ncbi:unnamed protein product [Allacma fusca]|uniref:Uncharacterized protein n=1 Tax=Allacma fusca TaxID=39272 RepID=A0A8J2Q1P3_9HEXA|nr:unnamed protein product [Allacma fusca]
MSGVTTVMTPNIETEKQSRVQEPERRIFFWGTENWSRVIALMSMMQHSVCLFIVVHEITKMGSKAEYFSWKFLVFVIIGLIITCVGVFAAMNLLLGIDRKLSSSLYSWIITTCIITGIILIAATVFFYTMDTNQNPWILLPGACLFCLLNLPCIWLINVHRQEIDREKMQLMIKIELHSPKPSQGPYSNDTPIKVLPNKDPRPHCSYISRT